MSDLEKIREFLDETGMSVDELIELYYKLREKNHENAKKDS